MRSPFLQEELVTITLEGSQKCFKVSKAHLCHASDYFTKALDGKFREASDRTLCLPGCDEPTLRLFIGFMACNALPDFVKKAVDDKTLPTNQRVGKSRKVQTLLINLWSFADRHLIPRLQNLAMKALLKVLLRCPRVSGTSIGPEIMQLAFEITGKGSIMCQMLVMEFLHDYKEGTVHVSVHDQFGDIPGFFASFVHALEQFSNDGDPTRPCCLSSTDSTYLVSQG